MHKVIVIAHSKSAMHLYVKVSTVSTMFLYRKRYFVTWTSAIHLVGFKKAY